MDWTTNPDLNVLLSQNSSSCLQQRFSSVVTRTEKSLMGHKIVTVTPLNSKVSWDVTLSLVRQFWSFWRHCGSSFENYAPPDAEFSTQKTWTFHEFQIASTFHSYDKLSVYLLHTDWTILVWCLHPCCMATGLHFPTYCAMCVILLWIFFKLCFKL